MDMQIEREELSQRSYKIYGRVDQLERAFIAPRQHIDALPEQPSHLQHAVYVISILIEGDLGKKTLSGDFSKRQ